MSQKVIGSWREAVEGGGEGRGGSGGREWWGGGWRGGGEVAHAMQ